MLEVVTTSLGTVITWIGTVLTALTSGALVGLLPLFAVGISISVVFLAVKAIRTITWGA